MFTERYGTPDMEEAILRSLNRSASYGIDPQLDGAPEESRLEEPVLAHRIQDQYEFYSLAREQLDTLYRLLRGTGFCMALADSEGYVLYIVVSNGIEK